MIRSIPPSLAGILEDLELESPDLVTSEHLAELVVRHDLATPHRVIAARLRDRGWLLPTGRRGVWEFAPASVAGPYSRSDPLTPLKAFLSQNPDSAVALTFQAAAWAHEIATRIPATIEVAAGSALLASRFPTEVLASIFTPEVSPQIIRSVPVLRPASVMVHLAAKPRDVRSWASAVEWLPELAAEVDPDELDAELQTRPRSIAARTGYLVQAIRPDLAEAIRRQHPPRGKTWFGPRGSLLRHDNSWSIADTLLPFDPRTLRRA